MSCSICVANPIITTCCNRRVEQNDHRYGGEVRGDLMTLPPPIAPLTLLFGVHGQFLFVCLRNPLEIKEEQKRVINFLCCASSIVLFSLLTIAAENFFHSTRKRHFSFDRFFVLLWVAAQIAFCQQRKTENDFLQQQHQQWLIFICGLFKNRLNWWSLN